MLIEAKRMAAARARLRLRENGMAVASTVTVIKYYIKNDVSVIRKNRMALRNRIKTRSSPNHSTRQDKRKRAVVKA